jgi:hypothetical protein
MGHRTIQHNNRDCREAVTLALYLANQWQQDIFILYGSRSMRYVLRDGPRPYRSCQIGYVISPAGEVANHQGFPSYAELFGGEAVVIQFRFHDSTDEWGNLSGETFRMHQKHRAERRVSELTKQNKGMEYRVWPA